MEQSHEELINDELRENSILEKGMLCADAFINKNYLVNLDCYPLVPMPDEEKNDAAIRLLRINRIVSDVQENANDKLVSVYSSFFNIQATGLLILRSNGQGVEFYLGVRSLENAATAEMILKNSFKGNFNGSQIEEVSRMEKEALLNQINAKGNFGNQQNIAAVSIVPSERDKEKNSFVQGIEKLIDTMKGKEFIAVFIAEPVSKEILERRKSGLQQLYSGLSPFSSTQLSYGENYSRAVSKSMSESFSRTLNQSLTDTNSHMDGINRSKNRGNSFSFLGIGFNWGHGTAYSHGDTWAKAVTKGESDTSNTTKTESNTDTNGNNRSITVTSENKPVKAIMEKIDQHLERIKSCEAFGLWDVSCYFVSNDIQTAVVAASSYKALVAGRESGVESSYVNIWDCRNSQYTSDVLQYLRYGVHPRFMIQNNGETKLFETQSVTPACLISGNELPLVMGLPNRSVPGVTVLKMAEFGRNISLSGQGELHGKKIELGNIFHMGEKEPVRVQLDLESFRSHCFVTGSTGAGKSNTTYRILDEMIRHGIPFLVIEPAKGEYKRYYGGLPGIHVYCTNPKFYSMLRINPFSFHQDIHVLEHLDRLIEIFNACWPLYAAMPAILKDSFERAYVKCGWDIENSIYIPNGHSKFPTFQDVMVTLPEVINSSSYSSDSKGDYTGALVTRVKSLANGISGQVLCCENDIDDEDLFEHNAIVDLSRVSSLETKSLLMGVLILKLSEYRMCSGEENQPLRHITVMEEAHNILKRSQPDGASGSGVQAKSVEMISAAIAEMRTYGEGFIIVDQSPTAVDVSAVKNTNTKIVMRLPDYEDARILGLSMGLNEDQMHEISRFPMGVAAVYQNNWAEAILAQIDKSEEKYHSNDVLAGSYEMARTKGKLVQEILIEYETGLAREEGFQIDDLILIVELSSLNSYKKRELIRELVEFTHYFEHNPITNGTIGARLTALIGCSGMFEAIPITFSKDYSGSEIVQSKIDRRDENAIRSWRMKCMEFLDGYALLTDELIKRKTMRYLLLDQRQKNITKNKYHLIYTGIYGDGGVRHDTD